MIPMQTRSKRSRRAAAWAMAILTTLAAATPAFSEDTAKELGGKLQQSKSRMMGMQIDESVALFKEATALLDKLKSESPGHKDLAKLQGTYDKLATDLAKKVTQRAERAINPMRSQLETAMGGSDNDKIKQARDKLAEAIAAHKDNLTAAGGESGASLLAAAEKDVGDADGKLGAPPAAKEEKSEKPAAEIPAPTPQTPKPAEPAKPTAAPAPSGGDPGQINQEIQRAFRGTRDMDTPALVKAAEEIRGLIEQLRAADPNHNKLAEYETKVEKLVADAYAADVRQAEGEISRRIGKIEMYLERNDENERPQLKEQRELLGKALEDHRAALEAAGPDGQKLIADTEAAIAKADKQIGTALAGDALINEWIEKLSPFNRNGEKDIAIGINSAAAHEHVTKLKAEAEQVWKEYQAVEFPDGKGNQLETTERYFQESLAEANQQLEHAVSSRLKTANEKVTRISERFAADQEWKTDKSKRPGPFADEMLDDARQSIEDVAAYVPDNADVAKLRQEHERLCKEAAERREANKSLTFVRAEKYKGADADELRAFAEKLVPKTHDGAKVLRLTLYQPEWKEETVTEWTDTTHSALRTRTTRTLMFCVAFEDDKGVFRDFGYLNQNRTSDGGWGPTYGHLAKYRNPMLKENVEKDEPE